MYYNQCLYESKFNSDRQGRTVVEHLPCHPKVNGLNPVTTADKRREINVFGKMYYNQCQYQSKFNSDRQGRTVVEHLPRHPKVKGSSPATTADKRREIKILGNCTTIRANMNPSSIVLKRRSRTVVEHLPRHPRSMV
jgi:hypothetical protein